MSPHLVRLRERFEANPGDRIAFEALEEHYFLRGEWRELVPIYESYLAAAGADRPAAERARLLFRMGQAIEAGLADAERAAGCYRQSLELDPGFAPALRQMRTQAVAAGRWSEARDLVEREAAGCARPEDRAPLLAELGELSLGDRGDAAVAIESFTRALEAEPTSRRALVGLAKALEKAGRLQQAVQAWERAIPRLEGGERAIATRSLGALLSGPLGELERALDVYEAAHRAEPQEPEWLEALAATLGALSRWAPVVALGERRLALARDASRRVEIALSTGRLQLDRLGDAAGARAWFERALEIQEGGAVHLALAEAAGRLGDTAGRTWHLERAMEHGAEIPAWSDLGLPTDAAPGAGADGGLELLRNAASERPSDPAAMEALAAALAEGHRDEELADALERHAELATTGPRERAALLRRVGEIRESRLDDLDGAAESYELGFGLDPGSPGLVEALERVLRKLERLDDLARVLEHASAALPAERAGLLCARGELILDRHGEVSEATRLFEDALALEPGSGRAARGAARAAAAQGDGDALLRAHQQEAAACSAERLPQLVAEMARLPGGAEAALPAARRWAAAAPDDRDALQTLARLLEESGLTEELVLVLEHLDARLGDAPTERAAAQRRLAWLHAAEGRNELALAAWRAALRHDPRDVASLEALLGALGEGGRDEEILALLDEYAPARDGEPRSIAERRARSLEAVGRHADAATIYRSLLQRERGERGVEAREPDEAERDESPLAEALERVARAAGDDSSLALALEERASLAVDVGTRARVEIELAILLEDRLDRGEEARALLARLATSEERDVAATADRRLEALLERAGDFAALCELLEARLAWAPRGLAWKLHARISEIAEQRLGDPGRARRHLEVAVGHLPEQAELWRRLANLYDEDAQPEELLRALEGEIATLAGGAGAESNASESVVSLHARAGRIALRELGSPERAEPHFRRVLELDPSHVEAGEFLIGQLEAQGRLEEIPPLLRARLAHLTDPADADRRNDLRLRLAVWLGERLGRPDEAADVLEAALAEAEPAGAIALRLADLYAFLRRFDALVALCEHAAPAAQAGPERAGWWLRAGEARRESRDDDGARQAYARALAEDPGAEAPRVALRDLARRRGDASALAALLEEDLERPGADERTLRAELADLCGGPLASPARALDHLLRLTELSPRDAALRERATGAALAEGRPDLACELLRRAAADPQSAGLRAGLWARCAQLLEGPLGRPAEAAAGYQESLRLDPDQPACWQALRRLLESLDRTGDALVALRGEWQRAPAEARAELAAHGADLAAPLGSDGPLGAWIERLARLVPDDLALWQRVAQIQAQGGRPADRERALARAARSRDADGPTRRDLHRERAVVLERSLRSPSRAIAALEEARRLDPRHPDVLAELDRLYTSEGRPRELLELLEVRMQSAAPAERHALERRAAACAESIGCADRSAELWLAGLADDTLTADARAALVPRAATALWRVRRLPDWARLAEEELAGPDLAPDRRVELRRELARAWSGPLAHPERALPHLRALVDDPAAGAADAEQVELLAALRAAGGGVELARRLASWLRTQPEDLAGWRELARLHEERFAAPAAAAEAWRELLRRDPGSHDALAGLRRASERCGDWPEVVRALEAELATESRRGTSAAPCWRRIGQIRLDHLADPSRAEQAFASARAADPRDLGALRGLTEIAESRRDVPQALSLHAEELALLGSDEPERRRALWLRIAALAPDPQRCADAFAEADAVAPLGAPQLAAWARSLSVLGATVRWCSVFARWCGASDASPAATDWVSLAGVLVDLGRAAEAEPPLARALAADPDLAAGWTLRARLREASGETTDAAEAWRSAGRAEAAAPGRGRAAAQAFARAAALVEPDDPARAAECLEQATAASPDFATAQAAFARVAERLGRLDEAATAAWRALAPDAEPRLEGGERLETARIGARTASALGRWQAAWDMSSEALALAPQTADALAARGLGAFHLGAPVECRRALEARLALPDRDPQRTHHLCVLARALESLNEHDAALARHGEALALDAALEAAHAGRLRVLERLGRREEAAAALAEWARCTEGASRRAERYVRAARLARLPGGDAEQVERWLLSALDAEPSNATAWLELATWRWEIGRADEAFEAASDGADLVDSASVRAALDTIRGRVLEGRGAGDEALAAFRRAAGSDPEAREAARSAARLLRARGEWLDAVELLRRSAERPGPEEVRADLFLELSRLLAGPLEDVGGAVEACRRARELAPERAEIGEAYAALLALLPERHEQAFRELAGVLERDPTRVEALRRLVRLARASGDSEGAARGLALLRALGATSPREHDEAPAGFDLALAGDPALSEPTGEALRRAFLAAAPALSLAAPAASPIEGDPALGPIVRAWRGAEAELAGAGVLSLGPEALAATARGLAGGDVAGKPGRQVARALRGADGLALARFDFAGWRRALRGQALAMAVDACAGDLRAGLASAIVETDPSRAVAADVDLCPWLAGSPEAASLWGRAVRVWLASLRG